MTLQFPTEFRRLASEGKRLFVSDPDRDPMGCPNCGWRGGRGKMFAFEVESGGYRYPPSGDGIVHFRPELGEYFLGRVISDNCPVCNGTSTLTFLRENCGVKVNWQWVKLADFVPVDGKVEVKGVLIEKVASLANLFGFVTLCGSYGTGKTFAAYALINELVNRGINARYITAGDMLASVRETFGENSKNASEELLRQYKGYRALVIDEVDRVNLTPWAQETLFRVIDGRYTVKDLALTVLITNSTPQELSNTGDLGYLSSRMTEGEVIQVGGADMRAANRPIKRRWTADPRTGEVLEADVEEEHANY